MYINSFPKSELPHLLVITKSTSDNRRWLGVGSQLPKLCDTKSL